MQTFFPLRPIAPLAVAPFGSRLALINVGNCLRRLSIVPTIHSETASLLHPGSRWQWCYFLLALSYPTSLHPQRGEREKGIFNIVYSLFQAKFPATNDVGAFTAFYPLFRWFWRIGIESAITQWLQALDLVRVKAHILCHDNLFFDGIFPIVLSFLRTISYTHDWWGDNN